MRAAKGSGNQTNEVALERVISAALLTFFRRHAVHLCQPEFIWLKARLVLFIEGCFWYGCPWRYRASVRDRAYRRG
jgi:G:T-mismatch repair DNA endonuclease (very short patch repair protein)